MPTRKPQRLLTYDLDQLPPRAFWKIQVSLTRADAAAVCEQLYALTSERTGASFYYPDLAAERTKCRYEWHRKRKGDRFGVRVGIVLDVGPDGLSEIDAYATTREAAETIPPVPPAFTSRETASLQKDVMKTLEEAIRRTDRQAACPHHIVYHVDMPYRGGLPQTLVMPDDRLRIFPTKIMRGLKRVSAVAFTVHSTSRELAKGAALKEINLFCALATLATDRLHQRVVLNWTKKRPPIVHLTSFENLDVDRLYPYRRAQPQLEESDPEVGRRLSWIWPSFHALPASSREQLLLALFAYYAGKTVWGQQATLAVVAYVAALSALATDKVARCAGEVSCSVCGVLPHFKHNTVGDRAAITQLIIETLRLTDATKRKEVGDVLARVYTKHRSAFVHGAELRHEEFHQGRGMPQHLPAADGPVQDIAIFTQDLHSLGLITRRTLLE
jgi:hypothetical protein